MFSGSIADNIKYGNPDATHDQVVQAAKLSNAHDFIEEFPRGYNTSVGERGVQLSGGQKQRIAIARALLKNPGFNFVYVKFRVLIITWFCKINLNLYFAICIILVSYKVFFILIKKSNLNSVHTVKTLHKKYI